MSLFTTGQPPGYGNAAFTASIGKWNMTNIGAYQPIVFDSAITNIGNGFDTATGVFRAPYA